ncbi:MAG: nucleotidyltransferase family protein, partial [Propionibacteriaceae bacterium]|nr:nucleotidyltransferase family protein [Propionibacteriaceae bacterium]
MALASQRQAILEAARVHGATDVRVFGSVARGTDGPASDIDLLVRMEPGRTIFDVGAFADAVEQLVGCPVDVV